jgi:small GTP-binding protein
MRKSQQIPDTKVIIVGDPSVGKTSLLMQFTSSAFDPAVESTVGALFHARQIETANGAVNLLMWDTAGQERYRSLIPLYSRSASAAILVVDVSRQSTYDSVGAWHTMLQEQCPPDVRIYVVANKIDLPVRIPIGDLEEWAVRHRCRFFKACASQYQSVEPIFSQIAEDATAPAASRSADTRPIPAHPPQPVDDQVSCC